ncbi:carbohydrate porin [Salinisphaera sp.]|uniref:carbohydrate porin n=1 Tax=Salinisphaera sp. TaxID=1914330 RepID=UPI002D7A39FB|nr:carbohydrate porin [Salinisphaera sp.]HET7315087.1 carbohydrate porin [Salinisphaera sp.]
MRTKTCGGLAGAALLAAGIAGPAAAADADDNAYLEGIVIGTYQATGESHIDGQKIDDEANGELYLFGALDMGPGAWNLEVRAATTPADHGVSSFYGSNASVGETTDGDGDGRIAVTQLFYELPMGLGDLRAGLLDPTAVLDGNDVANTEYTQFLAGAFVNNPTIGFPSFVLGGAYQGNTPGHLGYKLFVGSDSGLQAEDDPTYHNVFAVGGHRGGYRKGVFTGAELDWHADGYTAQAGVWYDTGEVAPLGRTDGGENGYGLYALAGTPLAAGRLEGRAGIANEDAQAAANFLSLAYELPLRFANRDTTLGVAVARTGDSGRLAFDSDPIYRAEAYWRINVAGSFYVSPDLQYINNAGFEAGRDDVLIGGTRVGYEFY